MPLAQSDMVKTFVHGISPAAAQEIEKSFSEAIDKFCDAVEIKDGSAQKAKSKNSRDFFK